MKKVRNLSLIAYSLLPTMTFAAYGSILENKKDDGTTVTFVDFLANIQSWLLGISGALAVLFIVYGGFQYVTSAGNKQSIETAKKTLTYAIMGLILVVLAGVIFSVITGDFLPSIFGKAVL